MQIKFNVKGLSTRSPYKIPVQEGGALNANYTQSEALAIICNKLGTVGLRYNKDFFWVDTFLDDVIIKFNKNEDAVKARLML
tara:strand:- start:308 stop:553 length:246 start_codon:yes stop_codon:yes gene_type:complete